MNDFLSVSIFTNFEFDRQGQFRLLLPKDDHRAITPPIFLQITLLEEDLPLFLSIVFLSVSILCPLRAGRT